MFEVGDKVIRVRGNHESIGRTGKIVEISEIFRTIRTYKGDNKTIKCLRCRVLWDDRRLRTWINEKELYKYG